MARRNADRLAFFLPAGAAGDVAGVIAPMPSEQPGHCALPAGQALTLRARQAGRLRVTQGRLWLTFSDAAQDGWVRAGDHFLLSGESLALAAGQTVVLESWAVGAPAPAGLCWEPAPVASLLPVLGAARWPQRWLARLRQALPQPLPGRVC